MYIELGEINMKKLSELFVSIYLIFHLFYALYMYSVSMSYGIIWTAIFVVETSLFYLGKIKTTKVLYVLSLVLLIQSVMSISLMVSGNDQDIDNMDYVVVLGYQLQNNEMSDTLKYRLDKAYEYAIENKNSKLVLCGGITRENTISEASVMKSYLTNLGLDETRILIEDKSTDTIENIQNSLVYIRKDANILVLSSNYHVTRAKMICDRVGLNVKRLGSKAPIMLIPNQLLFEKLGIIKMIMKM